MVPRISISKSALIHNVRALRAHLPPNTKLAAVVKANAYGHGRDVVAAQIADLVDYLAVASAEDALALAPAASGRVLMLAPVYGDTLGACVDGGVQVTVTNERALPDLDAQAVVHVLVDTGLHRLGVAPADAWDLALAIRARGARLQGVWCMVPDDGDHGWAAVRRQAEALVPLQRLGALAHHGGSALALERPDLVGDIARIGLALLGYVPQPRQIGLVDLVPSMTFEAPVLELRKIPAGDGVGYEQAPVTRPTVVATLGAGVAHGLHPRIAEGGTVTIRGSSCPILSELNLDHTMVDVTDAPSVQVGDHALVLGGTRGVPTSVDSVVGRLGLIVDHLVTPLSAFVERRAVA